MAVPAVNAPSGDALRCGAHDLFFYNAPSELYVQDHPAMAAVLDIEVAALTKAGVDL